jgi:O-antigen ligase
MNLIFKIYLFLLIAIIYSPNLGAIDMKATQWFYLSVLNTFFLAYALFNSKNFNFSKSIKHPLFITYGVFFLASIISTINAINLMISLERLTDLFSILITLGILILISKNSNVKFNYILILLTFGLFLESLGSLNQYRQIISFSEFSLSDANDIRGFYANKNITAAAIAFKLPFVIILMRRLKNNFMTVIGYLILVLASFTLLLLSARAVFLSISLCIFSLIIISIIQNRNDKNFIKLLFKRLKPFVLPIILATIIFNSISQNTSSIKIDSRVSTIIQNEDDESTSQRLRFYSHAVKQIAQTPIIGAGIGNWKILSIKYDAKNMYSYVVPFFTHNDFLEIFAETGILGIVPFLSFFLLLFKYNIVSMSRSKHGSMFHLDPVYLFIPFIIYIVDVNLNFPLDRPSMQIHLLIYTFLIVSNLKFINEKK